MSVDNLNVIRGETTNVEGSGGAVPAFTRRVEDNRRLGRAGLPSGRTGLFNYDRLEGLKRATLRCEVEKTDRLSATEAIGLMHKIHVAHGVSTQMEGYLYDYDHALFLCYAINGASQIGPMERVKFYVLQDGRRDAYEYATVATILGVDFRRFFRAYANEVVDACRMLYNACDFEDATQVEQRALMIQLADSRNVSRYPWLVADSTEAATNLPAAESAATAASKVTAIANSTNAVDRRAIAAPIRSMDNYDSSTGQSVSNGNDIHAAGPATYYK